MIKLPLEMIDLAVFDGASNMVNAAAILNQKCPWMSMVHCLLHVVCALILHPEVISFLFLPQAAQAVMVLHTSISVF